MDYYLTLNSPWAFLGAGRLQEIGRKHRVRITAKPCRFADVFARTGGLPLPKRSPERQAYRMMELQRWREHLGIPLIFKPKHAPADETAGVGLLMAAGDAGLDAVRLAQEIGRAQWERDEDLSDRDALNAAVRRAGIDPDALRASVPSPDDLQARWAANTEEAVSRGVFGAPSYVLANGEIFWGQDRLEFLDRALAKGAAA